MTQTPCAQRLRTLASTIHREITKPRGFSKTGRTMRHIVHEEPFGIVQVLDIQASAAGKCEVYVNLGLMPIGLGPQELPEKVTAQQCPFGVRVRAGDGLQDDRWSLEDDPGVERVLEAVRAQAGPWFDAHADPVAHLRRLESELSQADVSTWVGLVDVLCRMWAKLGERDKAAEALRAKITFFENERPHASLERVHEFARSLGIDRL